MVRKIVIPLGRFNLTISVARKPSLEDQSHVRKLILGYGKTLESRFPELKTFGLPLNEETAETVTEFYASYLPLVREESRSPAVRSMLKTAMDKTSVPELKTACVRSIALSDLSDGLAERAAILAGQPDWERETDLWEAAYGSPIIRTEWKTASRGAALRHYFHAHPELLRGKTVLHVAPEPDFEAWIRASDAGMINYVTIDGQFAAAEHHDITKLDMPSGSFDIVICHRVMEHVLDDEAGFSELFRVLRPGGLLNFSVPQMPQKPVTKEWAIPDQSHDGHVRQYGADLQGRMEAVGFVVSLEPWLLTRPHGELRAVNAYPMRMFNAVRPA
jgi:hypothetical protein